MLPRFYVPGLAGGQSSGELALPPEEARHLTRVLRLRIGDDVAVFDGRGREFRARVIRLAREAAGVELIEPVSPAPEPSVRLTLAQAVLKPDAMDDVVRDATMMGVVQIDPLVTSHIAVKEQGLAGGRATERWRRVAVASAKQCRRAVVPGIEEPRRLDAWLAGGEKSQLRLVLVEPAAAVPGAADLRTLSGRTPASAVLLIGPEGGWAREETARLIEAGCLPVTLGGLTLRADAAPVAAIAVVRFVFGDL